MCGMTLKSTLTLAQATEGSAAANIYEMHIMMIDKIMLGPDCGALPSSIIRIKKKTLSFFFNV